MQPTRRFMLKGLLSITASTVLPMPVTAKDWLPVEDPYKRLVEMTTAAIDIGRSYRAERTRGGVSLLWGTEIPDAVKRTSILVDTVFEYGRAQFPAPPRGEEYKEITAIIKKDIKALFCIRGDGTVSNQAIEFIDHPIAKMYRRVNQIKGDRLYVLEDILRALPPKTIPIYLGRLLFGTEKLHISTKANAMPNFSKFVNDYGRLLPSY